MPKKIQSIGINKDYLIKLHKAVLENLLQTRGWRISDKKLSKFTEFSRLHSQVLLFGLQDLSNFDLSTKTLISRSFDSHFEGLNEFIKKEAQNRSHKDFSEWLIERLKFAENYFTRALTDIPSTEVETKFLQTIQDLENYLESEYVSLLLPELEKIEAETKEELEIIYNNEELSQQEAQSLAFEFIDQKEAEAIELFTTTIQDNLTDRALNFALTALSILGLSELTQEEINDQLNIIKTGFFLNIENFFRQSFHKAKMTVSDNVGLGANKRSLATDQLKAYSFFNKNNFKVSSVSEIRRVFRAILAKAAEKDGIDDFKAVAAESTLEAINPKGKTAKILYLIKTKDEWATTQETANINVVDGLGLHHNSQEYYKPIKDLEPETEFAQEQRKQFLKSI